MGALDMTMQDRDRPGRVLVIEEEPGLRRLLEHFFGTVPSLQARLCASVPEAEAALAEGFQPEVALVAFPRDGAATAAFCGKLALQLPRCGLLLSGNKASDGQTPEAKALKPRGFIEKPISFPDLEDRIMKTLQGAGRKTFGFTRFPGASEAQIARLRQAVDDDPDDRTMKRLLAFSLYIASRYQDAADVYEELAAQDLDFYAAYYAGHTFARLNRLDRAIEFWAKAEGLAAQPDVAEKVRQRLRCARDMQHA
jgi:DNA-binding NarL/FixJ family response regulator